MASYDPIAAEYAAEFEHELDRKPFDRKMLAWLIERVDGIICDMGCGPGQVARYLHSQGAQTCGIDISAEMVRHARRLNPEIHFATGDMQALTGVADGAFAGIAAFYSILHIPRDQVVSVLTELRRVLKPDGVLLLAFHVGNGTVHKDEWWDKPVSIDFLFFTSEEMKANLAAAGFTLTEAIERDPYPEVEYPSRRAYIFARV